MSLFISYNREQKDFADKIESSVRTVCPILRDTNDIAPWGSIEEFMNRIRAKVVQKILCKHPRAGL